MNIWKEESFDINLYNQVDSFFENLRGSKKLEYREGQHTMALDIMDAIKNREISLIEAGVGSGKSWGYLVPLIVSCKDKERFKGFIISTSSIALQDQLQEEIKTLSNLLEIPIDVEIAKGKNNYICQKRAEQFLAYQDNASRYPDLRDKIKEGKTERGEYQEIPTVAWKRLNVDRVKCNDCLYQKNCQYKLKRKAWPTSRAIICNHDLLAEALKREKSGKMLNIPSVLVIDEAHQLEEKIRNSYKNSLTKTGIEALIYAIYLETTEEIESSLPILTTLNQVFRTISNNAKKEYKSNNPNDIEHLDSETSGFKCTKKAKEQINKLIIEMNDLIMDAELNIGKNVNVVYRINELKEVKKILTDIVSNRQQNIYWAAFQPNTKEHVEIQYVPKNINKIASRLLSNPSYAKVFTSATLTPNVNDYGYFKKGLGLDEIVGLPIVQEFPQPSPYDYDHNTILYCATDVLSPKQQDHNLYIESLSKKVDELLEVTKGRSLILFTSKSDMEKVYQKLTEKDRDFNIILQEDGKSADLIKEQFKNDETSCLLATGAFWEGVDIKGPSLEQVIITKLPFPIVDPVIQEKASYYSDGFQEVYMPEMLLKLKQGTGRLIRSRNDKGIISILDSRMKEYGETILDALPYKNVTGSIDEVLEFARENLQNKKTTTTKVDIKQ